MPLAEGILTIGRGESAGMRIDDGSLSRVHASFHRQGERLWVIDEGSSNGTFLNGRRIDASGAALSNGDQVRLGDKTIVTVGLSRASKETGLSRWQIVAAAGVVLFFLGGMMFVLLHFRGKREVQPVRQAEQQPSSQPGSQPSRLLRALRPLPRPAQRLPRPLFSSIRPMRPMQRMRPPSCRALQSSTRRWMSHRSSTSSTGGRVTSPS